MSCGENVMVGNGEGEVKSVSGQRIEHRFLVNMGHAHRQLVDLLALDDSRKGQISIELKVLSIEQRSKRLRAINRRFTRIITDWNLFTAEAKRPQTFRGCRMIQFKGKVP